jgi:redox-sensing transcriptional repressor
VDNHIPKPTIKRLCTLYELLLELDVEKVSYMSSAAIGERLLIGSHTIRKDINYIGELGPSPAGYPVKELKVLIQDKLGLQKKHYTCLVGLGRLGQFLLHYCEDLADIYPLVAGFDASINRLETMKTSLPLFPAYELEEIIKSRQIEIALVTIQVNYLPDIIKRLVKGGIKGIINFTGAFIPESYPGVWIKNLDILGELRNLSALLEIKPTSKGEKE